ncbi:acyltransferase family protein [Pseudomonas peli]|uniref:acyltransferase family protein n=1 Tax=Pseudomonas peli TaxID=592361 RepID=UPI003D314DB5
MDYRREIDGLRALAVLPVILFHAGFDTFSGGFVGVDVFFVISGYLITTIILAELEQGRFSIVSFYERRARRILPALFLVMLACIPFAWVLLSPAELNSFSKSLVAVPLFISNVFFWRDGGYFETAAELKPLLHTWSLAVEEQYYVLFPLFLMLFWRLGKRWILVMLGLVFVSSLAIAQWAAYARPDASFYLLPTRGWELLIGALAAFYLSSANRKDFGKFLSEVAGWLGVSLICYAVFAYSKSTPFPGVYALVPTLGAVLVILFATQKTYVGRFVGNKVFVGMGLISYSAYLWHQPVLAYARNWFMDIGHFVVSLLIVVVMVLSILSWKIVEQPFRKKGKFDRKFVFVSSFLGALFFILTGYFTSKIDFAIERAMAKELSLSGAIYSSNINERIFVKNRILYENSKPEAIVIGSSRIMQAGSKVVGLDLLNLSVSGASLEDLLAIWELSARKFNPSYVFLGADPWIFNRYSGQSRWTSLGSEYSAAVSRLGFSNETKFSVSKAPSSLNAVAVEFYKSVNQGKKIGAEDDLPSMTDKIRKDGSRVYNLAYANKSLGEVERGAVSFISYAMSSYGYSSEVRVILERFVAELKAQNRKVVFVLSPYHPTLFELMRLEDRKFLEIESIFREIAGSNGIQVIGSYDPVKVGCSYEDFYDGMHPKDECMAKVFSEFSK